MKIYDLVYPGITEKRIRRSFGLRQLEDTMQLLGRNSNLSYPTSSLRTEKEKLLRLLLKKKVPIFYTENSEPVIVHTTKTRANVFSKQKAETIVFSLYSIEGLSHKTTPFIGKACLEVNKAGQVTLKELKIGPLFRGVGIGTFLMGQIMRFVEDKQYTWEPINFEMNEVLHKNKEMLTAFFQKFFTQVTILSEGRISTPKSIA